MSHRRFPWLALVLGLILGIAGGLYYAWFLDPVSRVNIRPENLQIEDRTAYILLIAEAYQQDHDLAKAQERLLPVGERNVAELVKVQADTYFLQAEEPDVVCALSVLAQDLGAEPLASEMCGAVVADTPDGTPTLAPTVPGQPTFTPTFAPPTLTPTPFIPTATPTIILPDTGFDLVALNNLCEESRRTGLIQIFVYDEFDEGLAGVTILIEWAGGSERIYTGLKSEINPGYADFRMEPNTLYTVVLAGLSDPVIGIDSGNCRADTGELVLPTIQLVFEPQPPPDEEDSP